MKRVFTDAEVEEAVNQPPAGTRAYFRGRCVGKYRDALVAANWDSLVFDVGGDALKRVPMMEPLRGSKDLVGDLIDQAATAGELLQLLGGE
jgi:proteasome accessory factor A